ncbi:MAG: hypothetical protein HY537_05045, partial [Deltaproteobacteria bacterium]|nr:hypothetical protein [Deltaproteobacteria bacterium]
LEMGRAESDFSGLLRNEIKEPIPEASIRVWNGLQPIKTEADGSFNFPAVDFSEPILLESESSGHLTTLHTFVPNPREPRAVHYLDTLDQKIFEQSAKYAGMQLNHSLGTIVGGAVPKFFPRGSKCITLKLFNPAGAEVSLEQGPYRLSLADNSQKRCFNRRHSVFGYSRLEQGQYLLKWLDDAGTPFHADLIYVENGRYSVVAN